MALLLSLLFGKGKEMPAVTKKELLLLGQMHTDLEIHLIRTMIEDERWWKMLVVTSRGQEFEVQTALAKTKLWRRLDIAVDFIAETCPDVKELRVSLE
ncbi:MULTISPECIES: hypothetical protein [Burkholderia]|uniref:hypothetical protein n=1 Tax=Burkholderia TaxID=32008 RepID=UPI000857281B|nr:MULTISPECIES: hypothetical protein [unclassified Burkholderia]AOK30296.1 hypothetical protein AQ611_13490 [Burkholderia sp. Bp7605]